MTIKQSSPWYVYILSCADESLYTGITTDLERRIAEHNDSKHRGAKYTRSRLPVKLVYQLCCDDRAQASIRESQIKKLTREQKVELIGQQGDSG